MGYRLTSAAELDLRNIYFNGVERFGLQAADAHADQIVGVLQLLGDNPRMARERAEFNDPVRAHPFGVHVVLYRIEGEDVLVLRIRHGHEDWQAG